MTPEDDGGRRRTPEDADALSSPYRRHGAFVCEQGLLSCEDLNDVPFLILGNKIDLGRAASEDELRIQLGLHQNTTGKGKSVAVPGIRPMELFMCRCDEH